MSAVKIRNRNQSTKGSNKGKKQAPRKSFPIPIFYVLQPQSFSLSTESAKELLSVVESGDSTVNGAQRKNASEEIARAIGVYRAEKKALGLRDISKIRRRLEYLEKHSYSLLCGTAKCSDPTPRKSGYGYGPENGLINLDDLSRHLLSEGGAGLVRAKKDLVRVINAIAKALGRLHELPHVLPRWAEQHFVETLAIIFRDVLGREPTKSVKSVFSMFVQQAAAIAGISKIGKDMISHAIDTLNSRYVIQTDEKAGIKDGRIIFKKKAVSPIRPHVIGKNGKGKDIVVTSSD